MQMQNNTFTLVESDPKKRITFFTSDSTKKLMIFFWIFFLFFEKFWMIPYDKYT